MLRQFQLKRERTAFFTSKSLAFILPLTLCVDYFDENKMLVGKNIAISNEHFLYARYSAQHFMWASFIAMYTLQIRKTPRLNNEI